LFRRLSWISFMATDLCCSFFALLWQRIPYSRIDSRFSIGANEAEKRGLTVEWKNGGPLLKYFSPDVEEFFTLGQLRRDGSFAETSRLRQRFSGLGWPMETPIEYFNNLQALMPGASVRTFESPSGNKRPKLVYGTNPGPGSFPPFILLEPRKQEFFEAIQRLVHAIEKLAEKRE